MRFVWMLLAGFVIGAALPGVGESSAREPQVCPDGFPDAPVLDKHLQQSGIVTGHYGLEQIVAAGSDLSTRRFTERYDRGPAGTFSDTSLSVAFDTTTQGEWPRLEAATDGGAIVRAYTDLKRHSLCDLVDQADGARVFCNEVLDQGRAGHDGHPGAEYFLTRKLWDVGNSAPYGHRGDLPTITEAILAHGGEARATRDAFAAQPFANQVALIKFLKTTLRVLPTRSPPIVVADRS